MSKSDYRNFGHYIDEGWLSQPKESFKALAGHIVEHDPEPAGQLLDIGCATGELMAYLSHQFPNLSVTGADVFDELLVTGRRLLPSANFVSASALELPSTFSQRFDFVTAVGVMSIFDEAQVETFWQNLLEVTKPGGLIAVLSPLNEYGIDTMISHRKRCNGVSMEWETGWNVFSLDTIKETLTELGHEASFKRFVFTPVLQRREDPVRTWTLATETNPHQLTNGLKLLVDHYFMLVKKWPATSS